MKSYKRKEAKKDGQLKYFTGNACSYGHVAERYTGSGSCCECKRIKAVSDEKKAYDLRYYQENRTEILVYAKAYSEKNSKAITEKARLWAIENPDKVRAIKHNYKARRRSAEDSGMTSKALAQWAVSKEKSCYWCGVACKEDYHIDHYEPLSKGGRHELENLVISCPSCNVRKNAKDPYEFAQKVAGRLF